MARSPRYVAALKKRLKRDGVTYSALAEHLDLSESAVKQMFSQGNVTLKRLDAICDVLDIELSDLADMVDSDEARLEALTLEQERELIADARLLLVAYCMINNWSFDDIVGKYAMTESECIRHLARLDRMKLIELLPGNRVKPLIARNFAWQPNGPIEQYFRAEVQSQFFNSSFDEDGCLRVVRNGDITRAARLQIVERLNSIGQLFDDVAHEERRLPFGERKGTTMVLAIRNWELAAFRELERQD
ncbi:MAG: helix-turn-helix transcriptional regulator [Gammaproteobacteria bacterium]|nr:helix-turn-helix transcriptional regulator [Gammaproteobacteria bacterium]